MSIESVGRDKISYGDVAGSYNAIGAGAQVVTNHIYEAKKTIKDLKEDEQWAESKLVEAIEQLVGRYQDALMEGGSKNERINPYKALDTYQLKDAPHFYGRQVAIDKLMEKMKAPLTILHSASGSGKTSLIQAGLSSRLLAEGHLPLYRRPFDELPHVNIVNAFLPTNDKDVSGFDRFRKMSLLGFLGQVTRYLGDRHLYIFLDQFEEFFAMQTKVDRDKFAAELRECIHAELPVHWIFALRKEFFSDLTGLKGINPFANEYQLEAFDEKETIDVIVEPAKLTGVSYEPNLVARIFADLAQKDSERVMPAHVQLVCHALFDELQDGDRVISLASYNHERGREGHKHSGAKGILNSHLARVLDKTLDEEHRHVAVRLLEALVTSQKRRGRVDETKLTGKLGRYFKSAMVHTVLEALSKARLIRKEESAQETVYELSHDYLLEEIEVDPKIRARKVAQEMLDSEVNDYRHHQTLLGEEKYIIINLQRKFLDLDATSEKLLELSEKSFEEIKNKELRAQEALTDKERERAEAAEAQQKAEAEKLEEKTRRLQTTYGMLILAVVLSIGVLWAAVYAFNQTDIAEAQTAEAEAQTDRADEEAARANEQTVIAKAQTIIAISQKALANAQGFQSDTQLQLSTLLAIASLEWGETAEAADILRQNLARLPAKDQAFAREGGGAIRDIAFSPDGDLTAIAYTNREVYVWSVGDDARPTYVHTHTLTHTSGLFALDFSDAASYLATGDERSAHIWDSKTGGRLCTLGHGGLVFDVLFSPDGVWLATAGSLGIAYVWQVDEVLAVCDSAIDRELSIDGCLYENGNSIGRFGEGERGASCPSHSFDADGLWVTSLAFSSDSERLLTGGGNGYIWEIASGEKIAELPHKGYLLSVDFSADERFVATASIDHTAGVWDADTGENKMIMQHNGRVEDIVFSADGKWVATASEDNRIRVWDLAYLQEVTIPEIQLLHDATIRRLVFSPYENQEWLLASISDDATARLWDVRSGAELAIMGLEGEGAELAFHPRAPHLVATATTNGLAQLWDISPIINEMDVIVHDRFVTAAAFHPRNSDLLATATKDFITSLWHFSEGNAPDLLRAWPDHKTFVNEIAFSERGQWVVTASDDGRAIVWEITGQHGQTDLENPQIFPPGDETSITGDLDLVTAAAFSPDEAYLVIGDAGGLATIWNLYTDEAPVKINHNYPGKPQDVTAVAYVGNEFVVTGTDTGTVTIWGRTGDYVREIQLGESAITAVVYEPRGDWFAAASQNGTVWICLRDDTDLCQDLRHIDDAVLDIAVSPQGDLIATASQSGVVRLWEMESEVWKEQYRLVLASPVTNISFSNADNGRFLLMTNSSTARRWQVDRDAFVSSQMVEAAACDRVGRPLNEDEYKEFVTDIDTTTLSFTESKSIPSGQICSD